MANIRARKIGYALLGLFLLVNVVCGIYLLVRNEPRPVLQVATVVPATIVAAVTEQVVPAVDPHRVPVLAITKALYGDLPNGPNVDVTVKVAAMVEDNALAVDATNDNFGDPAVGIEKTLSVEFTVDGMRDIRTAHEGEKLRIVRQGPARLVIKKALYGDLPDGHTVDVTIKLAELVDNDALTVAASNDNFDDPAPGIEKTLRVEYTFDNQERTKSAHENDTLTISAAGE